MVNTNALASWWQMFFFSPYYSTNMVTGDKDSLLIPWERFLASESYVFEFGGWFSTQPPARFPVSPYSDRPGIFMDPVHPRSLTVRFWRIWVGRRSFPKLPGSSHPRICIALGTKNPEGFSGGFSRKFKARNWAQDDLRSRAQDCSCVDA